MTDDELVKLIRYHWAIVEKGDIPQAAEAAVAFRKAGITANCYVGLDKSQYTRRVTAEWFAGQLVGMVESGNYFGMNAWCNTVDKFVPESN